MVRVVQWATGAVGRHAVAAMAGPPDLEVVGVLVYSDDKAGRDAGELCGTARDQDLPRPADDRRAARATRRSVTIHPVNQKIWRYYFPDERPDRRSEGSVAHCEAFDDLTRVAADAKILVQP